MINRGSGSRGTGSRRVREARSTGAGTEVGPVARVARFPFLLLAWVVFVLLALLSVPLAACWLSAAQRALAPARPPAGR